MAAKVRWERGAWWVVVHDHGNRKRKRIGPKPGDKRVAKELASKIEGALALGTFRIGQEKAKPLRCDEELERWYCDYRVAMKESYASLNRGHIDNHLVPFFGSRDLREIREKDVLAFIQAKLAEGLKPRTIRNSLAILRRACNLLIRDERLSRNPVSNMGELLRRVAAASAPETDEVQCWTDREIETLLRLAREEEPRFAPLLLLLFSTGMRRGEGLGLKWADIGFDSKRIGIRRSITASGLTTPKSGKSRSVRMSESLGEVFFGVLAQRRREVIAYGWREVPEWVFCSETGTRPDPRNVRRVWERLRRRAQAEGVRSLKLHCTRHAWATRALKAGKSVRWVADQLGHSDPALTLRVYAHAMPEEETDVSFAEFDATGWSYTAPAAADGNPEPANTPKRLTFRN